MIGRTSSLALLLASLGVAGGACGLPPVMSAARPSPSAGAAASATERRDLSNLAWLLQRDSAAAAAEGAGPLQVLASDVGSEGDRVGAFVDLPSDGCLLTFARGSEGVDDLDMLAFSDEGTPIGSDEATDPHPGILLCPPQPPRAYVVARIVAGRGAVALGAQRVPLEAAARVGKALNARGRPGETAREPEVWPGLDAKAEGVRRETGGRWEELRRVALPVDARAAARLTAPIDAGRCLSVLVTPSDETSDLDVQLLDAEGRVVGRGAEAGRDRTASLCSAITTQVVVEIRPRIAAGIAAVVIARSIAGSEADIAARSERVDVFPTRDLTFARTELGARLKRAGYDPPTAQQAGAALTGRRATVALRLAPGCSRLDVVAGAPLAGVLADAWSEAGALLGRGEGGSGASVFVCSEEPRARVDIEATGRPGPFAVEVRAEHHADPLLAAAGLAGGRLLARLNASGEIVRAESLTAVKLLPLDATSLKTWDFRVPERRCVDVAAGVGASGSGVDLRLVDAASREELALSRAASSTVVRGCAGPNGRLLSVEVRLGAGKADVLLGAHLTEPARRGY